MKLAFAIVVLTALCAEISVISGWEDGEEPEKTSWPELVGEPGEDAKEQILEDRPDVEVVILPVNSPTTKDYRRDRVRVFVDEEGKVDPVPRIG